MVRLSVALAVAGSVLLLASCGASRGGGNDLERAEATITAMRATRAVEARREEEQAVRQAAVASHLESGEYYRSEGQYGLALEEARQAQSIWRDSPQARVFVQSVSTEATRAAAAPRRPPPEPTAVPSPAESLQAIAQRTITSGLGPVALTDGVASISYKEGFTWSEGTVVRGIAEKFKTLAPRVIALDGVQQFELLGTGDFTDVRGNASEQTAVKLSVTRAGASRINWTSVRPRDFGRILTGADGGVYVHPGLQQVWRDFEAGR